MPSSKRAKWLLIILGSVIWSLTMVKSGLVYKFGLGFWGANGHDGIWHISLINSLSQGTLEMPIFAGSQIQNYHLGFDILLAGLTTITSIPATNLYFQITPPLLALAIGLASYHLVLHWRKSPTQAWWSTFFIYFGANWGWLISYFKNGTLGGESMFWSQQSISTLINPPFALSLALLLLGIIFLNQLVTKYSTGKFILTVLIFSSLGLVKIYAGIIGFAGLSLVSLYYLVKFRNFLPIKLFLICLATFLILFFPTNRNSNQLIVWQPGWFLETLVGLSDRVNFPRLYSAMVNSRAAGNWPKAVLYYLAAAAIFLVGNLGTRLVGLAFPLVKSKATPGSTIVHIFLISGFGLGLLFPMFFLQSGTAWNTIQFFYYSQMFAGIYAGLTVGSLTEKLKSPLKYVLISLVLVLTLPTTIDSFNHYLPSRPPAKISHEEMEALRFLSKLPRGTVLTPAFDREAAREAESHPPRPLYLYESTAYVSAISHQPVYLEDEVNLNITGYDWNTRRQSLINFFNNNDSDLSKAFLRQQGISYIYLPSISNTRPRLSPTQLGLVTLFENSQSAVWGPPQ